MLPLPSLAFPSGLPLYSLKPLATARDCCPSISYANDNASASCFYDRATGALSTVEESTAGCPANAAGPNCNIGPTSQNFKKRAVARELTVAEQEIKKRQFHVERQG